MLIKVSVNYLSSLVFFIYFRDIYYLNYLILSDCSKFHYAYINVMKVCYLL